MTLSYVKRPEEFRKMKADKYFSKTGEAELANFLDVIKCGHERQASTAGQVPSFGASPHTPFGNILFCRLN